MSTLKVSNLNDGTTSIPTPYITGGSAKVYARINGTLATLGATLNVASLTDVGVGNYQINLTNNMTAADYAVPSSQGTSADGEVLCPGEQTASSFQVRFYNGSAALADNGSMHCIAAGNLA